MPMCFPPLPLRDKRTWLAALLVWVPLVLQARIASPQEGATTQASAGMRAERSGRGDAATSAAAGDPMAQYTRYKQIMQMPDDRAIRRFIDQEPRSWLAERLRADWVRGLAQRRDWDLVAKVVPEIEQPAADVACWGLRARVARHDPGALNALLSGPWRQGRELPDGCAAAARELAASGALKPAHLWWRARLLVGVGDPGAARRTMALLPAGQAPTPRQLDLALGTPERWFSPRGREAKPGAAARELAPMAIVRVAGNDPMRGIGMLMRHKSRLDARQRGYVHAQLGLQAARRLQDDAPAWFAIAAGEELSDEHRVWWVRSALRLQRWGDVRVAIQGMSVPVRQEPAWQYWLGRAESALGEPARAQGHWRSAAREQGFYGRLAREALGMPAPEQPVSTPTRREIEAIARLPGLVRAVALQRSGQWQDASAEWSWTVRRLDPRQQAAAAAHARQLGFWNRMIDTADHMTDGHPLALRYPSPYRELVRPAARSHGVEEALVYGVMHQESRFTPGAVSLAGARGLMQVMPSTASWLAGELGWRDYQPGWLDDPGRSIVLGTRYLRQLDADLGRSMVLAAAAYNAGPARALAWRGPQPIEGAVYAESIPFDETRDYVKRVMTAAVHYAELLGQAPQRLTERLGTVPPQRTAALEAAPMLTAMAPRLKTPAAPKTP